MFFYVKKNLLSYNIMNFKYIVSKIPTKQLYNVNIYKDITKFGNMNFQIHNDSAILNNLWIDEPKKGHGTKIINQFENYVKFKYDTKQIRLLAWQPQGSTNVLDFYCKNGYTEKEMLRMNYDDGIIIYDLYRFEKNINNY